MRSRASSFKWKYPLLSPRSSSSFLRLLPRLLVTSICPFIFPSITCFRRQFLRKMWPIQLAYTHTHTHTHIYIYIYINIPSIPIVNLLQHSHVSVHLEDRYHTVKLKLLKKCNKHTKRALPLLLWDFINYEKLCVIVGLGRLSLEYVMHRSFRNVSFIPLLAPL
jgi:hypothetical protein